MADFNTQLAIDSDKIFLQEGSELITYTPHGEVPKTIKAHINRSPLKVVQHGGRPLAQKVVEFWITNDATNGVASIKERFDKVSFKYNLDDAVVSHFVVAKLLEQDPGQWRLECHG